MSQLARSNESNTHDVALLSYSGGGGRVISVHQTFHILRLTSREKTSWSWPGQQMMAKDSSDTLPAPMADSSRIRVQLLIYSELYI